MIKKIYKVSRSRSGVRGQTLYPQICCKGRWIQLLGFDFDSMVEVIGRKGKITITLLK